VKNVEKIKKHYSRPKLCCSRASKLKPSMGDGSERGGNGGTIPDPHPGKTCKKVITKAKTETHASPSGKRCSKTSNASTKMHPEKACNTGKIDCKKNAKEMKPIEAGMILPSNKGNQIGISSWKA